MADSQRLYRRGTSFESARRLARKAAAAEDLIDIYGVSVTGTAGEEDCVSANRTEIERYFRVHDTPSRGDPSHCTVELPNPVTQDIAALFNRLFGRE